MARVVICGSGVKKDGFCLAIFHACGSRAPDWEVHLPIQLCAQDTGTFLHPLIRQNRGRCESQFVSRARDDISDHRHLDCLLNRLIGRIWKKIFKAPHHWPLWEGGGGGGGWHWPLWWGGRSLVDSPHKGPVTRKCFHFMTPSWLFYFIYSPLIDFLTFTSGGFLVYLLIKFCCMFASCNSSVNQCHDLWL